MLKKAVAAYAETPSTAAVIERVFGRTKAEFERGYRAFLQKQIDAVPVLADADGRKLSHEANLKLKDGKYDEAAMLYAQGEDVSTRPIRNGPPAVPRLSAGGAEAGTARALDTFRRASAERFALAREASRTFPGT